MADQFGVVITSGPADWQIIQQDESGHGAIDLAGAWRFNPDGAGVVEVRLAFENTSSSVTSELHWRTATTNSDGTWSTRIDKVPAGGLYRLETRLNNAERSRADWSLRGDVRHFLGVGDLWVIAGQSNSAGYGRGAYSDPPEFGIHLLRNSLEWSLATHPMADSTGTKHPVNSEGATSGHSPYLNFARVLRQHLGYPIGLIQASLGGSALRLWNPCESAEAVLFDNMVDCVRFTGGAVKGVVWYQGETDAGGQTAVTYTDRFLDAVVEWRKALGSRDLAVVTVQLNRFKGAGADDLGWSLVREAQRTVPKRDKRVSVVPALDLSLADGVHISAESNMTLGHRMAMSALVHAYAKPVAGDAPDLTRARAVADGTAIELTFEPVVSFLGAIDGAVNPFLVVDDDGPVLVVEVAYPGLIGMSAPAHNCLLLRLGRPLAGKTVVHCGYGADPPLLPMDMERTLPVLAFYNAPVE